MSKIRAAAKPIIEFLILLAILAIGVILFDIKMSKQLDNVDPTREEMIQAVPFRK